MTVVVCPEVPPHVVGGLGRYAERMIRALAEAGAPVTVLAAGAGPRAERHGSVTIRRLPPRGPAPSGRGPRLIGRNLLYSARATYAILRRPRRDVVAVHDWMGCLTGIACRLAGRRVVFHVHNTELRALAALETAQARLATAIVVPSSTMGTELVGRGWPADRIRVIPHGADDPALDVDPGEAKAVRDRYPPGPLLVFAGRLSAAKGVPTLLAAMRELPDVTLVLCGDGSPHTDEGALVSAAIRDLGLAGRVVALRRFLPAAEVYAHFLAADVCVFPSRYEPFGLVAVEAMALGRPVVLGPGHAPELGPALRCTGEDPRELAALIRRALAGEAPVDAAREHVTRTFRWSRTAAETLRCYAEAARR